MRRVEKFSDKKIGRASRAVQAFTGKKENEIKFDKTNLPHDNVGYELGKLIGVIYQADTEDGVDSRYIHRFKKKNCPSLVVLDNGSLAICGGKYHVTKHGIED